MSESQAAANWKFI